ncbi:hypothetical protein PHMEG_00019262 [Phytophthora megakarya]|uniref:Uncharacterized protein n=1 Tax=Phytophthora megakarya TaxID=4795 RepID=A0A225VSB6_9STRA|nr:hypothetical protein PHMEG_00019262 [Phytophthora megakarya]
MLRCSSRLCSESLSRETHDLVLLPTHGLDAAALCLTSLYGSKEPGLRWHFKATWVNIFCTDM